ncbi:MAG: MlaE family lipid ABC transporter permease subunit [Nitrospinae bacterium]|nr:MlaE family lipid ABC transporter permease subunit [Nitrospinota bacterium]MBI3813557.1 MlaE family lipid ABC transporter permease subunit [Nitrospinota bacterium]
MKSLKESQIHRYEITENAGGGIILHLSGRMDASNAGSLIKSLTPLLKERSPHSLTVDMEKVNFLDDFGVLVLVEVKGIITDIGGQFSLKNISDNLQKMLSLLNFESLTEKIRFTKKRPPGPMIRLGEGTIHVASDLKYLISFIGSVSMALVYVILRPGALRRDDTFLCMQKTGVDALPIVGLINFLLGLIMAFMSSVQLQKFGANIYIASLVSLSMTRELGPIMTAIIVAGRSGSAFAAEIGTMKVSEEVDALFTMGFEPARFLVVPKIIASVVVVPILTLFADLFAIMGGLIVGVTMLNLTASSYMTQTINTLSLFDFYWGVLKSIVFAFIIAWIGCLRGFQVRGGAASVGQAATSAVVSSIFMIIVADSIFAIILCYW